MRQPRTDSRSAGQLQDLPEIPGLSVRRSVSPEDYAAIAEVSNSSWEVDKVDVHTTVEDLRELFDRSVNFTPAEDVLLLQSKGRVVGYCRVSWKRKLRNLIAYSPYVVLAPEHRGHGLREFMLKFCEERARTIAAGQPAGSEQVLEAWASAEENSWRSLLERNGYSPSWHLLEMVRENLSEIPDVPLPPGIEVRPVRTQDLRRIWDAAKEGLRDENNFVEENWDDRAFEKLPEDRLFQPELWQIAWDGDEVVGGVHNIIDRDENEGLGRKWGHTEQIFVRRAWRGRGIAKALIARSLVVVRDCGMDAATLDVDSENPSKALRVYESMGYRKFREFTFYRKPL